MIPEEAAAMNITSIPSPPDEVWSGGWPQTRQEFEMFVDYFLDPMVKCAFRRLGNMEEAEDVVQDVFVKAYAGRKELRRVRRAGPYLYRMVANACSEHRRRRSVLSLEEIKAEDIPDGRSAVQEQIAAVEEIQRVEQYLRRLPGKQAEVIRLRVLDELSLPDIAEMIGCGLPTVKSRLRYGLLRLRRIVPRTKEESK